MLQRTEGIVLKTIPYGEADLIVTYLTKDYGIVKTFAKSPRKIKSRFGSSLEPVTYSIISFWGKADSLLPRLTQSDIIYPFDSLRSSLHSFLGVSELIELTLNFIPERDASKKIYYIFIKTLYAMEKDCKAVLLRLFYKVKLLDAAGYLPRLDECGRCGKKGDIFHFSHGSILCEKCSKGTELYFRLSPGVKSFYTDILNWRLSRLSRLKPSEQIIKELLFLIDEHMKYISEKTLRTRSFIVSGVSL